MRRLTLYLAQHIIVGILLSLCLVLSIETLFTLVSELRNLGKGEYTLAQIGAFIALSLPQKIYQFFPMAGLLGTLMGLGTLAQRSELLIMRASGWSVLQISMNVLKTALILAVMSWVLGEVIAPYTDKFASNLRITALSGGQAFRTEQGTWMRDGDDFVHIRALSVDGRLEGITRYQFDHDFKLSQAIFADHALYVQDHWVLYDIQQTQFFPEKVETLKLQQQDWFSTMDPEVLHVVGVKYLDQLSLIGLWRTIGYREANGLESAALKLAFWEKIIQPFSIIVMMLLAIPFIFGPLRQSSIGTKILTGIGIGCIFFLFHNLFGPLMLVYQCPPLIGAMLPTLLFLVIGLILMKRVI